VQITPQTVAVYGYAWGGNATAPPAPQTAADCTIKTSYQINLNPHPTAARSG